MNLLNHHHTPGIERLEIYRQTGGYRALEKAATLGGPAIIDLVERSGLRGRGGAAFPAGAKMRAVAAQQRFPHYFICNIAEGEPGSFKDHALLKNPHQIIEASAITSFAVGAEQAFIYLRASFQKEAKVLEQALSEVIAAGLVGEGGTIPVQIIVHRGEDSYIAGEETALLESLEGKPAIPRTKPPRPYEYGLWDCPTLVHNVETICNTISIVLHGVEHFRKTGTAESPGTKLFCVSGQISKPGLYELSLGTPLSELLYNHAGGPLPGRKLVAVFPGGPSTPLIPVEPGLTLDFESLHAAGSHLGTGGIIVIDDSVNPRKLAAEISSFFARESCGACPPCVLGTAETHRLLAEIADQDRRLPQNIEKIRELTQMMKFRGNCAHNRSAALTILSLLKRFPESF